MPASTQACATSRGVAPGSIETSTEACASGRGCPSHHHAAPAAAPAASNNTPTSHAITRIESPVPNSVVVLCGS